MLERSPDGRNPQRFGGLVGLGAPMGRLLALLERVARTDANLLVTGETGTGKEVCARAVHDASGRSGGPFVICDLAAMPPTLANSATHWNGAASLAAAPGLLPLELLACGTASAEPLGPEADLPFKVAKGRLLSHFEGDYLRQLLVRFGGNLSRAARFAQIDRAYLRKLLRKHRLATLASSEPNVSAL